MGSYRGLPAAHPHNSTGACFRDRGALVNTLRGVSCCHAPIISPRRHGDRHAKRHLERYARLFRTRRHAAGRLWPTQHASRARLGATAAPGPSRDVGARGRSARYRAGQISNEPHSVGARSRVGSERSGEPCTSRGVWPRYPVGCARVRRCFRRWWQASRGGRAGRLAGAGAGPHGLTRAAALGSEPNGAAHVGEDQAVPALPDSAPGWRPAERRRPASLA